MQYQGMDQVVLDSDQLEATARVQFKTTEQDGEFYCSPFWIDSLGHIAGFIMNANDGVDSKSTVFVNHGWKGMRCSVRFDPTKTYTTYNRMQNVGGAMHAGDTYILDGDEIVAVFSGIKFQGVPRRALDHLLPSGSKKSAPAAPSKVSVPSPATRPVAKPAPSPAKVVAVVGKALSTGKSAIATQALDIIAEEIGVNVSELTTSANFSDFGVDSLLSLTITGRLREELSLDVESSLFSDCPTVKDLLAFLPPNTAPAAVISDNSSSCETPDSYSMCEDDSDAATEQTSVSGDSESSDVMAIIRGVIAAEVGVPEQELTGTTSFAALGVDSLLSLTVLGTLRETLCEMDFPSTLFSDNDCMDELQASLGIKPAAPAPMVASSNKPAAAPHPTCNVPAASSIVLQGNPKTARRNLFLFPDGSGSATSYAPLPRIAADICVIGLNCPFMKTPQDMTCGIPDITPRYLDEVRRRQPHGPYYFGGWSAGGIAAFDAAQALDKVGEKVERLIFIDSPFPIGLEKLPPRLYDFFNSIGLFGEGKKAPPEWLLPHFLAFVDALDKYDAKPFASGHGPQTHIIWAKDGVCKNPGDPRPDMTDAPKEMRWLLNNRTDFGPNRWDELLGGGKLVVQTMEEANHFTMMEGKKVRELAEFVRKAMA
jgi:naphtho-gamma-pyrone polyketide synthase